MTKNKKLLITITALLSVVMMPVSWADETASASEQLETLIQKFEKGKYSKRGADECMKCHRKTEGVADIFDSVHGNKHVGPMAELQCETCHGPQGKHSGDNEPMLRFGADSPLTAQMQNSVCLSCHRDEERQNWHSSLHDLEEVTCVSCHTLHVAKDPILKKENQNDACTSCHSDRLADMHKRSSHPLKTGDMACTDCHSPHGSFGESSLKQHSVNENCYQCHADKRGPNLWEHEPVVENCANCHDVHGSVNDNLLKTRVPTLCKECHANDGHASNAPSGNGSMQTAGQGCMNCHSQIHGSNHPAGQSLQF